MKRGVLSVAWLAETVSAAWLDAAGTVCHWVCPFAVPGGDALQQAVGLAHKKAGTGMRRIAWLIDHRNLLFHIQETPPVKGRWIRPLLDRLVQENRFFDEAAIWAKAPLSPVSNRHRWLLALMPSSVWTEIERVSDENELEVLGVYPSSALLGSFLSRVEAGPQESVLLLAQFGGSDSIIVGRGSGQILFARSIARGAGDSRERLDQEINRTIHFSQQRFGDEVRRLIAIGSDTYSTLSGRTIREGLGMECLVPDYPPSEHAIGFAERIGTLSLDFSLGYRRQPTWVRPALAAGMLALLVVSVSLAGIVSAEARARRNDAERMRREAKVSATILHNREGHWNEARRLKAFLTFTGARPTPSVPAAFARYLRNILPPSLRLTALDVVRTREGWKVRLEGASRESGNRLWTQVEELENELTTGVFRVNLVKNHPGDSLALPLSEERLSAADEAMNQATSGQERTFAMEGDIR